VLVYDLGVSTVQPAVQVFTYMYQSNHLSKEDG